MASDLSSFFTGEWGKPQEVTYNRRDLLLYAVGIGCGQAGPKHYDDLKYVYEQEPNFTAFPTYPVVLSMKGNTQDDDTPASSDMYLGKNRPKPQPGAKKPKGLPIKGTKVGVDYERYIVKVKEIPTNGAKLFIRSRLYGVTQRPRGVITESESELYGEDGTVYYKFISGGFGIGGKLPDGKSAGQSNAKDIKPPSRTPDKVDELKVGTQQHLVYRLSGDYNPLHIDPKSPFVKGGGFPEPILHGLCSLGHAARMVLRTCGGNDPARFRTLKVRFSSPVLPGQTLQTQMWEESGGKVIFITKVKETGKTVISNAFMELAPKANL